jgi:hypothetical protein
MRQAKVHGVPLSLHDDRLYARSVCSGLGALATDDPLIDRSVLGEVHGPEVWKLLGRKVTVLEELRVSGFQVHFAAPTARGTWARPSHAHGVLPRKGPGKPEVTAVVWGPERPPKMDDPVLIVTHVPKVGGHLISEGKVKPRVKLVEGLVLLCRAHSSDAFFLRVGFSGRGLGSGADALNTG